MKIMMLALGFLISVSAFADSYSPKAIYQALSSEELNVQPEIFAGKVKAKSVGGLTCLESSVDAQKTKYVCGVDNADTLKLLEVWTKHEVSGSTGAEKRACLPSGYSSVCKTGDDCCSGHCVGLIGAPFWCSARR